MTDGRQSGKIKKHKTYFHNAGKKFNNKGNVQMDTQIKYRFFFRLLGITGFLHSSFSEWVKISNLSIESGEILQTLTEMRENLFLPLIKP